MATAEQEKAEQTIKFIDELKKSSAFRDWYVPRLKQRQAALQTQVMTNKALTGEEREHLRRIWQEYEEEIIKLLDVEAGVAQGILRSRQ